MKHCRLLGGAYASIRDVDEAPAVHEDRMETFWLVCRVNSVCEGHSCACQQAETLKYLYLIFSDGETVRLDENVFTTEVRMRTARYQSYR